jgi:hypothetical protein
MSATSLAKAPPVSGSLPPSDLDPLRQVQFLSSVLHDEHGKALALGDAPGSSGEASSSESDEVCCPAVE